MDNNLYSTLTLSHFPFFFDVVCTQVHCLPINDNYENNVFKKIVRILPSMSLDSIVVSSVVSVSGPYTEFHKCVISIVLVLVHKCFVYQQIVEFCCEVLTFYCCNKYCLYQSFH